MGLLTQKQGAGWVHADAEKLDRQLREGDGLVWTGDPTLELRVGILTASKPGVHPATGRAVRAGEEVFRRYEVWTEVDGREELVGHWRLEEFDRILFDVAGMKASFEGKRPDVVTQIDAANEKIEKENSDKFRDSYGTMLDHGYRLAANQAGEPDTNFYQVGNAEVDKNGKKTDAG